MIVTHTHPNGEREVLLADSRFPNGPLSQSDEDMVEWLEWNITGLIFHAKRMPANAERQSLIAQVETQKAQLNIHRNRIFDKLKNAERKIKLDKP